MKIIHYSEVEPQQFDGDAVKGVSGRVVIGQADKAPHFCMRVFEIEPDGFTPRHAHEWEHEIFFHAGSGEILREGQWVSVKSGYTVFVPANEEHQIRNIGNNPLIFACLIPSGIPEL